MSLVSRLSGSLVSFVLAVSFSHAVPLAAAGGDHEAERRSFKTLPGFKANLFAGEELGVINPIHHTWDPAGRMWLICSPTYPQILPGETPGDYILVLEDTDKDGRADKSWVFATNLYVPTGLELGDGGVYVANAPDLLFLKDTDGDGRADIRKIMLTGFSTVDNHHSISAWIWGPGGWLYFQEGTFTFSQIETPHGPVRTHGNGSVHQYRPKTGELRIFHPGGMGNPWGHAFDYWGQSFMMDNPRFVYLTPGTGNTENGKSGREILWSSGKNLGGAFFSGKHIPDDLQDEVWTCHFKIGQISRFEISENKSTYAVKAITPFLTSDYANFRPVQIRQGPDGAAYIVDWYNPVISHAGHDLRDPIRDKTHGRIWRISSDKPLEKTPNLRKLSIDKLLLHLKNPLAWARYQVKRVIADLPRKTVSVALEKYLKTLNKNDSHYDHHRLEALWSYQTIDVINEKLLREVVSSKTGQARAAAVRVLRYWHKEIQEPLAILAKAVNDPFPRVRLESLLTLSFIPDAKSMALAIRTVDHPFDNSLEIAFKNTAAVLEPYWKPAYQKKEFKPETDLQKSRLYALAGDPRMIEPLAKMLKSRKFSRAELTKFQEVIVQAESKKLVNNALSQVSKIFSSAYSEFSSAQQEQILGFLLSIAVGRKANTSLSSSALRGLIGHGKKKVRIAAVAILRVNGDLKLSDELLVLVKDKSAPLDLRYAAAAAIGINLGAKGELPVFTSFLKSETSTERYIAAYGKSAYLTAGLRPTTEEIDDTAKMGAGVLVKDPKGVDPVPLYKLYATGGKQRRLLMKYVTKLGPLHTDVARALIRHLDMTGDFDKKIRTAFAIQGQTDLAKSLQSENMGKLVRDIKRKGDPDRGELIYRKMEIACVSCHAIGGAGPAIGPDLAALGSSSTVDYVVESILEPSKTIKEFFESVLIQKKSGEMLTGSLISDNPSEIVFRDSSQGGKEITINKNLIREVKTMPSLMPPGLVNGLASRQDFLDLVHFLSALGKEEKFSLRSQGYVRSWKVAGGITETGFGSDEIFWMNAYSRVGGGLPSIDLKNRGDLVYLKAELDVTRTGRIEIGPSPVPDLAIYLDGEKVRSGKMFQVDVNEGRRTIIFVFNPGGPRWEGFSCINKRRIKLTR